MTTKKKNTKKIIIEINYAVKKKNWKQEKR